MAYSTDLREKVIIYLEKGNSIQKASSVFSVGTATIYRWLKQKKEQGHLDPKKKETSYRKFDYDALKAYVDRHPDHVLLEIAAHFKVTLQAVFYPLKKLGITRKKRRLSIKKGTKD